MIPTVEERVGELEQLCVRYRVLLEVKYGQYR